jgi:hypothetical protein
MASVLREIEAGAGTVLPDPTGGRPSAKAGHKPIREGEAVERQPNIDALTISPAQRKRHGIEDHEVVVLKRNPKYWEDIEKRDDAGDWVDERAGRRIIFDDNGNFVKKGDTILCVKSRAEQEQDDKELNDNVNADYGPGKSTSLEYRGAAEGMPQFDPREVGFDSIQQSSDASHNQGLIGTMGTNPTAGHEWMDIVSRPGGKEALEAEQEFFRMGPTHSDERNRAKMQDPHQPRQGKNHAIGAGFDASGKLVRS